MHVEGFTHFPMKKSQKFPPPPRKPQTFHLREFLRHFHIKKLTSLANLSQTSSCLWNSPQRITLDISAENSPWTISKCQLSITVY